MIDFIITIKIFYGAFMDLRNLKTFIQVAELNSFTKAADRLGYSQPTVSFQIKQLEDELGVQLFERIGHTVTLTHEGRRVMEYAQKICHMSEEMVSHAFSPSEPSGTVRLAMADSLCAPLVLEKFSRFRKVHPNISIIITSAGTDEMFRMLEHNDVDIVCTLDRHIYNTSLVIKSEEKIGAHFVCSPDNPIVSRKKICVDEIIGQSFLLTERGMSYRSILDEELAKRSIALTPVLQLGNTDLLCKLAEEGVGITLLPDYVTHASVEAGRLVRLALEDLEIEIWKQVIYHRDKWISQPMQIVLDFISGIVLG